MVTARKDYPDPTPKPRQIREDLKISRERMARLLDVSSKTIERWEERNLLPSTRVLMDRLAKIQEIVEVGRAVYTQEGFRRFLATPMAEFDGRTALQLIEMEQGDRVLSALAADYEGLGY
ncbi:MAG: DUF2384 domain-containing protein [Chloroflexi bacterium]|nr:DUF2384 domain-containing protein [Chloroflexota bacterium]MDA8189745.1 DUF2384 domain-containing protein [Dehalococcoidales bacterium]